MNENGNNEETNDETSDSSPSNTDHYRSTTNPSDFSGLYSAVSAANQFQEVANQLDLSTAARFQKMADQLDLSTAARFQKMADQLDLSTATRFQRIANQLDLSTAARFQKMADQLDLSTATRFQRIANQLDLSTATRFQRIANQFDTSAFSSLRSVIKMNQNLTRSMYPTLALAATEINQIPNFTGVLQEIAQPDPTVSRTTGHTVSASATGKSTGHPISPPRRNRTRVYKPELYDYQIDRSWVHKQATPIIWQISSYILNISTIDVADYYPTPQARDQAVLALCLLLLFTTSNSPLAVASFGFGLYEYTPTNEDIKRND